MHNLEGIGGSHPIWKCPLFAEKTVKERIELVRVNKACQRCLAIGCPGADKDRKCRKNFKCLLAGCGGDHNRLLHAKDGTTLHASEESTDGDNIILPKQ